MPLHIFILHFPSLLSIEILGQPSLYYNNVAKLIDLSLLSIPKGELHVFYAECERRGVVHLNMLLQAI